MKNKENILNIVIVSLDDKFNKNVSSLLADKLEMFFADTKELIEYDLINPKDVLQKCGIEYFKKREKKVVENISLYEGTIISIPFDLFKDYFYLFEKSIIIYLELPEGKISNSINHIAYQNRNEYLVKHCDIKINLEKKLKLQTVNKIIEKLGEIL